MSHQTTTIPEPSEAEAEPVVQASWHVTVSDLLAQAATICGEHDVDLEGFVRGAYSAYLDTRPGMREYLEDQQLRKQLELLRNTGLIAKA